MRTNKNTITEPVLIVDSNQGIYGPKQFIETINDKLKSQISPEIIADLSSPENEFYCDAWDSVENITFKHNRQKVYAMSIEGDIWLVPACYMRTKEFKENWF